MKAPYPSKYFKTHFGYEQHGNYSVVPGEEIYLMITERQIPGIQKGRYAISSSLNVFDYVMNEPVIPNFNTNYPSVALYNIDKGRKVTYSLHRVYMLVFCHFEGCEEYEVNHIDGNKQNFHPSNLEWLTHQQNMSHANKYLMETKLSDQDIIDIIAMYNSSEYTIKDIGEKFGISVGYVADIVTRKPNRSISERIEEIRRNNPITREPVEKKLTDTLIEEIAKRYSNGEEYFELASEYGIDRSYLTKSIKEYSKTHSDIIIRPLKKLTEDQARMACDFFQNNPGLNTRDLYTSCAELLGLENSSDIRKSLSNLYNRKTYTNISSNYRW